MDDCLVLGRVAFWCPCGGSHFHVSVPYGQTPASLLGLLTLAGYNLACPDCHEPMGLIPPSYEG